MDKNKQIQLVKWLKQQSIHAKRWLHLSIILGAISGILIVNQAWLLADILQAIIVDNLPCKKKLIMQFAILIFIFVIKSIINFIRGNIGFIFSKSIINKMRKMVLDKIDELGPFWAKKKNSGSWATIIVENIENTQDYYARYLPQLYLSAMVPTIILITIFPINWIASLIFFFTAPLVPLFMILVGTGAADINRKNFIALARLSGRFLDRLRGLDTLRLFYRAKNEVKDIEQATEEFRIRTMKVLRMAFLSSAVLEFFTAISIALVAVYFGFSFLEKINFGNYGLPVTLFTGYFILILAPEFFQPLKDLGTYYHAKAQAIGAAESIFKLLTNPNDNENKDNKNYLRELSAIQITKMHDKAKLIKCQSLTIDAKKLEIFSHDNTILAGPLDFLILPKQRIAIVGQSGAGKSSILNLFMGFLPYRGSITINGIELRDLNLNDWRKKISWVGQNPHLPAQTIKDNLNLYSPTTSMSAISIAMNKAYLTEFTQHLPHSINTPIGENAACLSVGQVQRIAVARALLNSSCQLLLLDEPSASLDIYSEQRVMTALNEASTKQTTILITHLVNEVAIFDQIWVMENGLIIEKGTYNELINSKTGAFNYLSKFY